MPDRLEIIPVRGLADIEPGADLAGLIVAAAPWLRDADVLVVTSKIVSKAEGRLVDVPIDGPERDAAREEWLTAETARVVAERGATRIVATHHGFVMAAAGIDASNVERSRLVLLPKDPDASARALRGALRERHGLDVAVIVSDTMGRPWRNALTDVALGVAGLDPIRDHRGERDAHGNELVITQMAVADELSGAAELVKGKSDRIPVAVVRGYLPAGPARAEGPGAAALIRDPEQDLFSLGTAEARAAGLTAAADLTDAASFGPDPVPAARLARALAALTVSPGTVLTIAEPGAGASEPPAGEARAVRCAVADAGDPAQLVALGADVHRLRCRLAADNLATKWLPAAPGAADGLVGLLAVGLRDR
jgi:coenzyme F420-0:L-glutamate ligase / coenzyme F420-1:gamma-L-glutamate ligase